MKINKIGQTRFWRLSENRLDQIQKFEKLGNFEIKICKNTRDKIKNFGENRSKNIGYCILENSWK
jgi:hypothetical protein